MRCLLRPRAGAQERIGLTESVERALLAAAAADAELRRAAGGGEVFERARRRREAGGRSRLLDCRRVRRWLSGRLGLGALDSLRLGLDLRRGRAGVRGSEQLLGLTLGGLRDVAGLDPRLREQLVGGGSGTLCGLCGLAAGPSAHVV